MLFPAIKLYFWRYKNIFLESHVLNASHCSLQDLNCRHSEKILNCMKKAMNNAVNLLQATCLNRATFTAVDKS